MHFYGIKGPSQALEFCGHPLMHQHKTAATTLIARIMWNTNHRLFSTFSVWVPVGISGTRAEARWPLDLPVLLPDWGRGWISKPGF